MADARQIVRIFISSPGDVVEERDQARRVLADLERRYPEVTLQPVLWEELALPATASFQESIDFILNREPIDIAVFILWSRLGTPLGAARTRADGTPYRSGTEREFDLMLAAFEQSGQQRPVILAYARDDVAGFKQKLHESDDSQWKEMIHQRELAEAFIREQFYDSEGRNTRALQSYREPIGFADRLRAHLKHALDDLLGSDAAPRWDGEPYRGLEAFDVDHEMIFHGRDEEACELLERLRDQDRAGCAFVVIVGASGSGKSSLARAGVAASLLRHAGDDSVKLWKTIPFVPSLGGADLCTALLEALYKAIPELDTTGSDPEDIAAGLKTDPTLTFRLSLAPAFTQAATTAKGGVRVLLVLDQLEELWTDRRITAENRTVFFAALDALARSGHVSVLATLRSDFYPHAQAVPAFLDLKGDRGHFDLRPPGVDALRQLITEPARLAGLQFERHEQTGRTLDQDILQDAAHDPGALPLLQYTLAELDSQREGSSRLLTFAAYEALGGVEGAIGTRAAALFQGLDVDTRAALHEILPLLVTIDVAGEQAAVRQRAPLTELRDTPSRQRLTDSLIAARFLATDRQSGQPVASLAHEALLRRWDRIVEWIAANREHLRLRARVEQNQQRWEQQDRDNSLLLPAGLLLEEGRQLLTDAAHLLNEQTADYIRVSIDHHEQRATRTRRRRRAVLVSLSTLSLLAVIGGTYAWFKAEEAESERQIAESERRKAVTAETKAVAAEQTANNKAAEADEARQTAERNAYNSDMLLAQRDWENANIGHLRELLDRHRNHDHLKGFEWGYWNRLVNSDPLVLKGHTDSVSCVGFSPDGKRIVSGGDSFSGEIKVWDLSTGQETLTLKGHTDRVTSVAFSLDGKRIVSGSYDDTLMVWDAATGQETLTLKGHTDIVNSVSFSPDGKRIVSGSDDKTVKVWDAATGQESLTLNGHTGSVYSVAFSPDGKRLASASYDNSVIVWDTLNEQELVRFKGHTGHYRSVTFSPDGTRLASAGSDNSVIVWDTTLEPLTLGGHTRPATSVAFSPDGNRIVSGSWDATVMVWDATTGQATLTLDGHTSTITGVSFSPDGKRIASTSDDGTVRLWDAVTGQGTLTLKGHTESVTSVSFSPDGKRLASAGFDDTVKLWDAATGQETHSLEGHTDVVVSVAFNRDGTQIASASGDKSVKVWDAASGQEICTLTGHASGVTSVVFGPDGTMLVSASGNSNWLKRTLKPVSRAEGEVKLWDANTWQEIRTIKGHTDFVTNISFSSDGTRFTSASMNTIKLWDTTTWTEMLSLKGPDLNYFALALSPNGTRLAASLRLGSVIRIWDARPTTPELRAQSQARRLLRLHRDRVNSLEELRMTLRADKTISDMVREQALDWAELFWKNRVPEQE